jgi:hypothetical protein
MPRGVPGRVAKPKRTANSGSFGSPQRPSTGRQKGACNKFTGELKQTILNAVHSAHLEGLHGFIRDTSMETPTAAFALLGRLVPTAVEAKVDGTYKLVIEVVDK